MKTGRIYRLNVECHPDVQEYVDISDMEYLIDDAAVTEIVSLTGGPVPIRSITVDNDENIFTVVRGQRLELQILTDNPVSIETFSQGSDRRWHVHHYINSKTLFKGYLVLDDISEAWMPEPNILTLTASDGLGFLVDRVFVDSDGNNPVGEYKIIELIRMALSGTGLSLGIKAAFNIKNEDYVDDISSPNVNNQHLFNVTYLNAKTFESEIGKCVSCREVLEYILKGACIFQRQGYWWIKRIDEIEANGLYITEWDEDGEFVGNLGEVSFVKQIGVEQTIIPSKEESIIRSMRPHKRAELEYKYDRQIEIVENIDFERGEVIDDTNPDEQEWTLADWSAFFSNTSTDDAPTTDMYVRKIFEFGYQKEKYLVIEAKSGDFNFFLSSPMHVGLRDKLNLSLQFRISGNPGGSGFFRNNNVQLRLYGDDGTYWTHDGKVSTSDNDQPNWVECTSTFRTNQRYMAIESRLEFDQTEWMGLYSGEVAEIPTPGYIRLVLGASEQHGGTYDTHYSDVNIDWIPYINGSYSRYTGQRQTVEQSGELNASISETLKVCEAPRRFKGALLLPLLWVEVFSGEVTFTSDHSFKIAGYQMALFWKGQRVNISGTTSNNITETRVKSVEYSVIGTETIVHIEAETTSETDASTSVKIMTFELAELFYDAARDPDGSEEDLKPYSELLVFDVFNQYLDQKTLFDATVQGLDLDEEDGDSERDNIHLIHRFEVADPHLMTEGRAFDMMSFDFDHRLQEGRMVLREVYNAYRSKTHTGNEFKYI